MARSAALADGHSGLIGAIAAPDLNVVRAHKACQSRSDDLGEPCRWSATGSQDLPHMPN
jgi:hypothetical protein